MMARMRDENLVLCGPKASSDSAATICGNAAGSTCLAGSTAAQTRTNDSTARAGDHFLAAGDLLRLQAGQQLVLEMIENNAHQSVYFSWETDAVLNVAASPRRRQIAQAEVRQPLLALGACLRQAAWALSRLVHVKRYRQDA
jgi:hypothetical protein